MQEFDSYAAGYSAGMDNPLKALVADSPMEFLVPKAEILKGIIPRHESRLDVLDFGCGSGDFLFLLSKEFPHWKLAGTDVSIGMMNEAKQRYCQTSSPFELKEIESALSTDLKYDLVIACCVFHHIPPEEWSVAMSKISKALTPGGAIVVFEHNPWNPITSWVVARTEIDKNAILLTARTTRSLMIKSGLKIQKASSFLFTPPKFFFSSFFDKLFGWSAMGTQYYVMGLNKN